MFFSKIENSLHKKNIFLIAGVDEAGRGPLAGPVCAAAVILPINFKLPKLNDSKKLSPKTRERLFKRIKKQAVAFKSVMIREKVIDKINILQASLLAMQKAVTRLKKMPEYVIVDGNTKIPELKIPQTTIVKGDSKCPSIAAASIIAKVLRDRYMLKLHKKFPQYGFDRHKGYGTKFHRENIKKYGTCKAHRISFKKGIA